MGKPSLADKEKPSMSDEDLQEKLVTGLREVLNSAFGWCDKVGMMLGNDSRERYAEAFCKVTAALTLLTNRPRKTVPVVGGSRYVADTMFLVAKLIGGMSSSVDDEKKATCLACGEETVIELSDNEYRSHGPYPACEQEYRWLGKNGWCFVHMTETRSFSNVPIQHGGILFCPACSERIKKEMGWAAAIRKYSNNALRKKAEATAKHRFDERVDNTVRRLVLKEERSIRKQAKERFKEVFSERVEYEIVKRVSGEKRQLRAELSAQLSLDVPKKLRKLNGCISEVPNWEALLGKGIYILVSRGEVTYVGQSVSEIRGRVKTHRRDTVKHLFDRIFVIPMDDENDYDITKVELALIRALDPIDNIAGKGKPTRVDRRTIAELLPTSDSPPRDVGSGR